MTNLLKEKHLYHITLENIDENYIFKQRVPKSVLLNENVDIKRICVSDSITGCFMAVPWNLNYFKRWQHSEKKQFITVIEFDISKINKENIFDSSYLFNKELVIDALETGEYWIINENIKPNNIYKILPTYIREGQIEIMNNNDYICIQTPIIEQFEVYK